MEHEGEQDWYHDVLTGAMKYLHEDAPKEDQEDEEDQIQARPSETLAHIVTRLGPNVHVVKLGRVTNTTFAKVISSGASERLRYAFARSMSDEMQKMDYELIQVEGEGIKSYELKPLGNVASNPEEKITEDEIEEKISGQLTAVIEESLSELKEMRAAFNTERGKLSNEFEKKLLEISNVRNGDSA